jgi:hypothetical protein
MFCEEARSGYDEQEEHPPFAHVVSLGHKRATRLQFVWREWKQSPHPSFGKLGSFFFVVGNDLAFKCGFSFQGESTLAGSSVASMKFLLGSLANDHEGRNRLEIGRVSSFRRVATIRIENKVPYKREHSLRHGCAIAVAVRVSGTWWQKRRALVLCAKEGCKKKRVLARFVK